MKQKSVGRGNMVNESNRRIVYGYLFNYFEGTLFKGKTICGACINLNIRVYKEGQEVLFADKKEPFIIVEGSNRKQYLFDVFEIAYDREKQFVINRILNVEKMFQKTFGWEKIEWEVIRYELDYLSDLPEDVKKNLPEEFKNLPLQIPIEVSEQEFRVFLVENQDGFDILDNRKAQVPCVSWIF